MRNETRDFEQTHTSHRAAFKRASMREIEIKKRESLLRVGGHLPAG